MPPWPPACYGTETSLSDFRKIIVTVMKTTVKKLKPKVLLYRDYSKCSNDNFRKKNLTNLSMKNISTNSNGPEKFLQLWISLVLKRRNV